MANAEVITVLMLETLDDAGDAVTSFVSITEGWSANATPSNEVFGEDENGTAEALGVLYHGKIHAVITISPAN